MTVAVQAEERALSERIELVKTEYTATCSLIDSLVRTSSALRALAVTLAVALLGVAVTRSSWVIAGGAAVATGIFGLLDAYHGWLYSEALRRARETERILALRYKQLERRAVDPDSTVDLDTALATHRFGQYLNLPDFRLVRLKKARPTVVYAGIYGALGALSVAVVAYYAVT